MSALLNYTTSIDVHKTLGEVQGLIAKAKARRISIDYDEGDPVAVAFEIDTPAGVQKFRLPMNAESVFKVLSRGYERGAVQRRFVTKEQAARVGWRIIRDWVAAQCALVETEMVTLDEVMMPYMLDNSGRTLYAAFAEQQLALPGSAAR